MTPPKPPCFYAKRGRKTKREMANQIKTLKMLATANDLTAWQACQFARCGYDLALKHFRDENYFKRMKMSRMKWFNEEGSGTWDDFIDGVKRFQKTKKIVEKLKLL